MNKTLPLWVFLSLAFLILLPAGCGKKDKKGPLPAEPGGTPGELRVAFASPQGPTSAPHESEKIVVIFDKPMVPLEALPEGSGSALVNLTPSFPGKFRWLNPRTLAFTPDKRFPHATEISATIPAGTRSLEGYVMAADYTWSFQTTRPRLLRHHPHENQKWLNLDTQVLLVFNQPVEKSHLRDFLSVTGIGPDSKEIQLDFQLKTPSPKWLSENDIQDAPEQTILLTPRKRFSPDFSYVVELKPGLPGKEGALGMEKGQSFRFKTFHSFVFDAFVVSEQHDPLDPLKFRFSNPVAYKEFIRHVRFEPRVQIPEYYAEWEQASDTLWINLPLEPETKYRTLIDRSLKDEFGNTLGKEIRLSFTASPFRPSVSLSTGHGILEAYSDLRFPIYALNTPEIRVQAARIKKEDIISLLNLENFLWADQPFTRKNFFRVEETLKLDLPRNKRKVVPLDFKKYLPDKHGIIFLQLDTQLEDKWSRYPKAFLQATELGMTVKFSPDNTLVWITELATGRPAAKTALEIRNDDNKVLWRGRTDNQGLAEAPGWQTLGLKGRDEWSRPQQWVFATRDQDLAFLSSEWETGIPPYRFGISYDWNPRPLEVQGYVFTDRGIYRAGETVHVKGILRVREKGAWRLPSVKRIECVVSDPFEKNVFKNNIDLDAYGSFHFDLETFEEASLGQYQIRADIPPEAKDAKPAAVYGSFRVEAFRPAEFEVLLRSHQEEYFFGDTYQAEVRAKYLFGGAMASQGVRWHLRLNPASFTPPGHEGYVFGNQIDRWETYDQEDSRLLSSGESSLDQEGKIIISAKLQPEKEKDSVSVALEATVQGPSRRAVSSRIQTLVHRGDYYIGLQPNTTFLTKGKGITVNVISVRPEGSMDPKKKIDLRLVKREWHSVRKSEVGGRFRWVSETEDTEIKSLSVETTNIPLPVSFKPEKSGFYLLKAEGKDRRGNLITSTTTFYVTGKDYVPWERKDEDVVELEADRVSYRPGDTAKILVKSPYESANALITLEREFVLESRIIEIVGSANPIEIPITSDHIPNVYVAVLLVQGRTAPKTEDDNQDLGKPSFKVGYIQLEVDPSEKRLKIEVQKQKPTYKPGEEVALGLKLTDWKGQPVQGSLALAVVDIGVLNLIGFETPDPFSEFYRPKPLAVHTSETRPFVISQMVVGEKGEEVGGGVGEKMMMAAMPSLPEIELRGDFKFTAYWNPSVETDQEGKAGVRFKLPDNLTTFRIMAVAQTRDTRFGRSETTFRVTKPLLLQAALPRFARVGDEFQGGLVVHNHTPKKSEVRLDCQARGIVLLDQNPEHLFSLEAGEGREILYSFRVEEPGAAVLEFRARMGQETDGLRLSLPLQMSRPIETVALADTTTESKEEKIKIPEDVYLSQSRLEFRAAASALAGLKEGVDFLTDYRYLCLEQRLSSILPYIVAKDVILDFKLSKMDARAMQDHVKKNIRVVFDHQKNSGGFGLWTDAAHESPYVSCYAAFALAKAREAGFAVEQGSVDRMLDYLRALVYGRLNTQDYPYSERTWKTTKAFALYALALWNRPEPSYAEKLYTERESLSLLAKTLLLKALHLGKGSPQAQNILLKGLMNKIKVMPTTAHVEDDEGRGGGWIYSSNIRTTALILQSLLEVGSDDPLLPGIARWLVERRKAGRWPSTQENFYVFYALDEFYRKFENVDPGFRIEVSLTGTRLLEEMLKNRNQVETAGLSLADFKPGKTLPLKIQKKGAGTLFYQVRMSYAPKKMLSPRDEGFSITKTISSLDGRPLETVKAGSLVVVTLEVILPQESLFVVVDDPLPAGLEAVNPTFMTESEEEQHRLRALSEEEGRWWWQGFNHIEMHDDRVLLFADSLSPGIHTHRYLARALTFGTFGAPGTKAEEMYTPEVFGRSAEVTLKIQK